MTANIHLRLHIQTKSVFNIKDIFIGKMSFNEKKKNSGEMNYIY